MKETKPPTFGSSDVAATFESYNRRTKPKLLRLRHLIFEAAKNTHDVGDLQETLKWGQPSYLTPKTKSGSTIRLGPIKSNEDQVALYFHCQTTLVPTFKELYGDILTFDGNRAILLDVHSPLPEMELRHCIALALTYHLRKKKEQQT